MKTSALFQSFKLKTKIQLLARIKERTFIFEQIVLAF